MYAIIRDRGKQYRVAEGEVVDVDLMPDVNDGDSVEFKDVLLASNGEGQTSVGEPTVPGASVSAQIVGARVKGKKIDVVHFRRRKDSMDKTGHRQPYTRVKIGKIEAAG